MPPLGQMVTYITDTGVARAAIVSSEHEEGFSLHVLLHPGDTLYATNGPLVVLENVQNDPTGTQPNSYH